MNLQYFLQLLEALDPQSWQQLAEGANLLIVDDSRLEVNPSPAQNIIIHGKNPDSTTINRQWCLNHAETLLEHYYRTTPLSRTGFDQQVEQLIKQHGAAAFAAPFGAIPTCTLFVEQGEVVAETAESPRHRYGAFYELERPVADNEASAQVLQWLKQGSAYEHYLSMNMCRYNC